MLHCSVRRFFLVAGCSIFLAHFWSCNTLGIIEPPGIITAVGADTIVFAVIGDYGKESDSEKAVADLVKSWQPDFILTTGDNNYQTGDYSTLHQNIGQYYCDYIYNYDAPPEYQCLGRAFEDKVNRFFPSPGNHDGAGALDLEPYLNYFTLPGKESYYSFTWGNAVFFSINSLASSDLETQRLWLEAELAKTGDKFKIVYFHYPPYSPGSHGDSEQMQWNFLEWGADLVVSGHDHIYARMEKEGEEGLYYIVNGLGGRSIYTCNAARLDPAVASIICYNENYGAMRCKVTFDRLEVAFYSISDPESPVDWFSIE